MKYSLPLALPENKEFTALFNAVFAKILEGVDKIVNLSVKYIPLAESFAVDTLDAMFAPKQILRQLFLILAIRIVLFGQNITAKLGYTIYCLVSQKGKQEKQLFDKLSNVQSYTEWKEVAQELDILKGFDKWRTAENSSLYDCKVVKRRIKDTLEMLDRGDVFDLMFRIRGGLARDQFGIQHEGLFTRALSGSKVLVEQYHETIVKALTFICDSPIAEEEIPSDAKLAFFNETRHSYGRTALLLSGGAYLGYYHMGVVKALFKEGLLPRVISGASAGSIITAIIGTRNDVEVMEFYSKTDCGRDHLPDEFRTDFFRISNEVKSEMGRRLNYFMPQGLRWFTSPIFSFLFDKKLLNLDTDHFKKTMIHNIGHWTFQEAFDRTGRIINITVAPLNHYDPPRLLNYLTAPHVCVWSAAAASCALPGMFDSISLIVKEPNGQFRPEHEWTRQGATSVDTEEVKANKLATYSDGSLENDLPMEQLSELFNVNHFIVSQVNPHSAILSSMALRATLWSNPIYGALVGYTRFLTAQCRDWLKNIVNFIVFRSNSPVWSNRRGITQTLTQEYEGRETDITIMPWAGHINPIIALLSAIKNPTASEFAEVTKAAEANTWPHIARIRAHCLVEMTLDKCVQRLRKHITEESAKAAAIASAAVQATGLGNRFAMNGKFDRTPSFYTSRSIVNLSGLSVADPVPLSSAPMKSMMSNQSLNSAGTSSIGGGAGSAMRRRPSLKREGSYSLTAADSAENMPGGWLNRSRSHSITQYPNLKPIPTDATTKEKDNSTIDFKGLELGQTLGLESTSDRYGDDAQHIAGQPPSLSNNDMDLSNSPLDGLSPARIGMSTMTLSRVPSTPYNFDGIDDDDEDEMDTMNTDEILHHTVHKTTTMANFYYKRSQSSDELGLLTPRSAASTGGTSPSTSSTALVADTNKQE